MSKSYLLTVSIILFCGALLFFILIGINPSQPPMKAAEWGYQIRVLTIDSCQYVVTTTGQKNGGISVIHKANCSNCKTKKI